MKKVLGILLAITMLICFGNVHATAQDISLELARYNIVKGNEATWDGENMLIFLTDGDGVDFNKISVDGKQLVLGEGYVLAGDNSVFKLKPEFLKTLESGSHELLVEYVDGYARGAFMINDSQPTNNDIIYVGIALGSIIVVSGIVIIIKKKK